MRHPQVLVFLAALALSTGPAPRAAADGAGAANDSERPASTGTTRIGFAAREWLDVDLDVQGVRVDRIKLRPPGKLKGLFIDHGEPNRGRIVVTNRTDLNVHPSVAVAVFDAEGRLLAAANTGAKRLPVRPGRTEELDIHFGGVFQHIERGAWLYVTIEY